MLIKLFISLFIFTANFTVLSPVLRLPAQVKRLVFLGRNNEILRPYGNYSNKDLYDFIEGLPKDDQFFIKSNFLNKNQLNNFCSGKILEHHSCTRNRYSSLDIYYLKDENLYLFVYRGNGFKDREIGITLRDVDFDLLENVQYLPTVDPTKYRDFQEWSSRLNDWTSDDNESF